MTGERRKEYDLSNRTNEDLQFRLNLVKGVIKMMKNDDEMKTSPLYRETLEDHIYKRDVLQKELTKRGLLEEPVRVQLKPAKLNAKSSLN